MRVKALVRDEWNFANTGIIIPSIENLVKFLELYCEEEINALANEYPGKVSLNINYNDIQIYSSGLLKAIETKFFKIEKVLVTALLQTKPFILKSGYDSSEIIKDVRVRVRNVPSYLKVNIRDIGKQHSGKLVSIDGFARNVADRLNKIKKAAFECLRCNHVTYIDEIGMNFREPDFGCENETCGKKGPFNLDLELSEWVNFQRMIIQEFPDSTTGTRTHDILVECEEDLTNIIKTGDRVTVTGVLSFRQQSGRDGKKTVFDKVIEAVSVEKTDVGFDDYIITSLDEERVLALSKDPELIDKIINSIAPSIYGYDEVKEALAYHLFSGIQKILPDGTKLRGDIHVGLLGDPGGAKTQMLIRVTKISPRGIFTSGKTASTAGLTAAAVKDPLNKDGWVLEGGAAVMASGGTLAIDEIGQADDKDKSALHEVMEQQTVSIAKAGNVVTLNAKCGILIAGNPANGYFERGGNYAEQINIPPALWSRIDLLFIVLDNPERKKDTEISNHILKNHRIGAMIQHIEHSNNPLFTESQVREAVEEIKAPIDDDLLRVYIAYARKNIYPVPSVDVSNHIREFYLNIRSLKMDNPDNPVPITARSLEAIERLAEARARMRLSQEITFEDVDAAKKIVATCLRDIGMDKEGRLDANLASGGKSLSQINKVKWLFDTIKKRKNYEDIIESMKNEHGVQREEAESLIKEFKTKGKIWEFQGVYKVTNPD